MISEVDLRDFSEINRELYGGRGSDEEPFGWLYAFVDILERSEQRALLTRQARGVSPRGDLKRPAHHIGVL